MEANNRAQRSAPGLGQVLSIVLGAALLIGLGFLMWLVFSTLLKFLENANPSVSAAVVGAIATVLVGLGAANYTQNQIKAREIESAHRSKKVEIYSGFLRLVERMFSTQDDVGPKKQPSNKELVEFFVQFHTDLILWGSPKVINAYLDFKRHSGDSGRVLFKVDRLYRAIREDLGLSTRGLPSQQLVKMYLKDPDELDGISPRRA